MMPPEGPNKAEELLQRYAKKSREQGGDFSFHPATRLLLQGEVARQHGSSGYRRTNLGSWFGTWRSRVVFGVAAASATVIVTLMVWNPAQTEQAMHMAKNEPMADTLQGVRPQEAAKPELAEVEKQVALLGAMPAINESGEGIRSKEKALAGLQAKTDSLSPVQNLPAATAPLDYYFAYSAIPSTNVVAFNTAGASPQNLWAAPPASPPLQLGYSLNGALADQRGFAPTTPRAGVTTDAEASLSSRFNRIVTNGVMLADTALYAKDSSATPLPTPGVTSLDAKRFGEVAQVQLRSEVKGQAESFGVNLTRSGAEEDLARNRKLNFTQPAPAADTAAKATSNPDALALGVAPATAPAEQKPTTAGTAITRTLGDSPAGGLRADFDDAPAVFYRQSDLGKLPQVAQKVDSLQKKTEAAPQVLSRFTIEQRGETFRILETDGSVYEGAIDSGLVTATEESKLYGARDKDGLVREAGAGSKATNASTRSYSFRAAGSNVTLRQNVVVNGRLSAGEDLAAQMARRANGSSAAVGGGAGSASTIATPTAPVRPATQPSPQRALLPGTGGRGAVASLTNRISTIEGTVRVGVTNEQRFRAVQAPR